LKSFKGETLAQYLERFKAYTPNYREIMTIANRDGIAPYVDKIKNYYNIITLSPDRFEQLIMAAKKAESYDNFKGEIYNLKLKGLAEDVKDFLIDMVLFITDKTPRTYRMYYEGHKLIREYPVATAINTKDGPNNTVSDDYKAIEFKRITRSEIKRYTAKVQRQSRNGAMFPYYNTSAIDLTRFQIFANEEEANYDFNCLIFALIQSDQLSDSILCEIMLMLKRRHVGMTFIRLLSDKYAIKFSIQTVSNSPDRAYREEIVRPKDKEPLFSIELALYKHHWIIYERVYGITEFFIKNYFEIVDYANKTNRDIKELMNVGRKIKDNFVVRKDVKYVNSLKLIMIMDSLGLFIPIPNDHLYRVKYREYATDDVSITETTLSCVRMLRKGRQSKISTPLEDEEDGGANYDDDDDDDDERDEPDPFVKNTENNHHIIFADFETITTIDGKTPSETHTPFMVSWVDKDEGVIKTLDKLKNGDDFIEQFLSQLPDMSIVYFHNLKYDKNFLFNHLIITKYTDRDNTLYSIKAKCARPDKSYARIEFRDSYKVISSPLSKFGKMFGLQHAKEIMPYGLYNQNNLESLNTPYSITRAKSYLSVSQYKDFTKKIGKRTFIPLDYARYYCEIDVWVLWKGMEKFNEMVNKGLGLNIYDYLTISSIATAYLKRGGCYENVYEITGSLQAFVQKSVMGGRVMTAHNKKHHEEDLIALDANSLYPTAMTQVEGFPVGRPTRINVNGFNPYQYNFYTVEIELTDKFYDHQFNYAFPLLFDKKDGVIRYTNKPENRKFVVNNYSLQDLIKFYDLKLGVEYKVLDGIEFKKGYNRNVVKVIDYLYDQRCIYKKDENPLELIFKLILNSAYGKTLLKNSDYAVKVFNIRNDEDRDKRDIAIMREHENVKEIINTENHTVVKLFRKFNSSYNYSHVGAMILSKSKQIMNNLFHYCYHHNIDIFYQDTDSLFIRRSDYHKIPDEFIGKTMGKFHNDLKHDDFKTGETYAKESYFVGKKFYCCKLANDDYPEEYRYKIRAKGVNEDMVLGYREGRRLIPPMETYQKLYEGKRLGFRIEHSNKPNFEQVSINEIRSKEGGFKFIQFQ
jgi:hypothetical protein